MPTGRKESAGKSRGGGPAMVPIETMGQFQAVVRAFQSSRVILSAVELDLFTAVAKSGQVDEVAERIGASVRGTKLLLDALVSLGLVEKSSQGYRNSRLADTFLVEGAERDQRLALMHTVHMWESWSFLTESVKKGGKAPGDGTRPRGQWVEAFIGAMHAHAFDRAAALAEALDVPQGARILDLGGGSGAYAMALVERSPGSSAVVLDLPAVVPLTEDYVAAAGLSDRVTTRSGDMLMSDLGEGYDLVLLSSICHMFGPEDNARLIRRCAQALRPGGLIVISDFLLDEEGTGPLSATLFSLNMLVATEQGRSYKESEYRTWLTAAGFEGIRRLPLGGPVDAVLAVKGAS